MMSVNDDVLVEVNDDPPHLKKRLISSDRVVSSDLPFFKVKVLASSLIFQQLEIFLRS